MQGAIMVHSVLEIFNLHILKQEYFQEQSYPLSAPPQM